ncbi:MAG: hypothetical protein JXR96_26465 [Deltaproteobacteria bacterium]|nr:hypothetical protein [Deltaproteobacteria bacterium]
MVDPIDIPRILLDAVRLVKSGEIVVFGSSALAFWLESPPQTRDVDIWCEPSERGDIVQAVMGELSWYDEKHGAYVEVWAPETFAAPRDWRSRARTLRYDDFPDATVVVPHPHDVLLAKLERLDESDREHVQRILAEYPLDLASLESLSAKCPQRSGEIEEEGRLQRFEHGIRYLEGVIGQLP